MLLQINVCNAGGGVELDAALEESLGDGGLAVVGEGDDALDGLILPEGAFALALLEKDDGHHN